jgi:iron complex transport system ATP-binding protein
VTYDDADHIRADAMLAQLGMGSYRNRTLESMSEGERTTVLLARVLMAEPALLLLDEPASGLDLGARERLLGLLDAIALDPGTPRIMVSHHLEELPASTSHALVFKDGRIVAQGAASEVIASEVISEAFEVNVEVERHGHGRYVVRSKA